MNISECITDLIEIRDKHGEIEVYFDCPKCGQSFPPNKVVLLAVHITEKEKK